MRCEFPEHHAGPGSRLAWLALAVPAVAVVSAAAVLLLEVAAVVLVVLGVAAAAGVVLLACLLWRDRGATWRPAAEPVEALLARALGERAELRRVAAAPPGGALPARVTVPGEVLVRSDERWQA